MGNSSGDETERSVILTRILPLVPVKAIPSAFVGLLPSK
jgi:hypothetical protein